VLASLAMLCGKLAEDARVALAALSRAFLRQPPVVGNPSLGGGEAGVAIAHAALERVRPGVGHEALAEKCLSRAAAALTTMSMGPMLDNGFTGIAWAFEYLAGNPDAPEEDDVNAGIDAVLADALSRRWTGSYELLAGLAGIGVYALERLPRPSGAGLVELIVERLDEMAVKRPEGIAWRTPIWDRRKPGDQWNLGLAHGIPGVIGFLGRVCGAGVLAPAAPRLLEGAVDWLLAQELPRGSIACFPRALPVRRKAEPERLAWCYGDAGVAAALLVAAKDAREKKWERHAIRIAMHAAQRDQETAMVVDAALCHGAAGLGHIFHRMFRTTGEAALARASKQWFGRTLAMRGRRGGYGGFAGSLLDAEGKLGRGGAVDLISGATGVALALAAAIGGDEDAGWDRTLMMSGNPV